MSFTVHLDSGHGGQKRDLDGDEDDGLDEGKMRRLRTRYSWSRFLVIYPVDYESEKTIVDDVSSL